MSKELRAELERLQSEIAAVRLEIGATAFRIPEARAHAKNAEDSLSAVKDPLDLLLSENRALAKQIKWENARARPLFWVLVLFGLCILLPVLMRTCR